MGGRHLAVLKCHAMANCNGVRFAIVCHRDCKIVKSMTAILQKCEAVTVTMGPRARSVRDEISTIV
jgi:hypothetical protein